MSPLALRLTLLLLPTLSWISAGAVRGETFTPEQLAFFENRVRPLLVTHCYECHSGGAEKLQADLRLDFRDALLRGGDSGPVLEPGDAEASLLVHSIRYESYEMPPAGKLTDDEIDVFVRWIEDGAAWPDEPPPEAATAAVFDIAERKTSHWSWQPIRNPSPPPIADSPASAVTADGGDHLADRFQAAEWPSDPLDHFVLRQLLDAGLQPAAAVDRRGLIRRLSFDLTGLPPTPQQVAAFVDDSHPAAVERLVDSLLDSPRFGERWGRHWLDLVRYAESRGHEFDHDAVNAFAYRDYVIRAFNADLPYDQLVTEHIAGDLLAEPRNDPHHGGNESVLATGFWHLGEWVHSPVDTRKDESDRFDNMIDVMSKTFLGMTVACARCHDHKFDAISTADYYALYGFLRSSDFHQVRYETLPIERQIATDLADLDQRYRDRIAAELNESVASNDPPESRQRLVTRIDQAARQPTAGDGSVLLDYARVEDQDFIQNGFLFGPRPLAAGELRLVVDTEPERGNAASLRVARQDAAVADRFWNGIRSISQGGPEHRGRLGAFPMAGRTLRTPKVLVEDGSIAVRARGKGHVIACVDSHRLIAGPLHGETVQRIDTGGDWAADEDWQWVRLNLSRYVGGTLHFEFVPDHDSPLEVALIVQAATPQRLQELEREQAEQSDVAARWQQRIDQFLASDSVAAERVRESIERWAAERETLRRQLPAESRVAMAMLDGSPEDAAIFIRGNSATPGKVVPRRFLSALDGEDPLPIESRSGRLELARRINDPANPLTGRVIVNRVWHHLMGRGIVPTTDDFGVLGQPPSHPDLLDHLATRFLAEGRSIKTLVRRIVLSSSYRMSSHVDPRALEIDPANRLWHHREPQRLDGESIRDSLLAISGRLDRQMYGESVPIHLTTFMEGRGRPGNSGPVDGDGRRSLYVAVRRNFLSPFMLTFDTPVPFSTMGRRNVSNVPAQALTMMNDPLVVEQARLWAERLLNETASQSTGASDLTRDRIRRMYLDAFARYPSEAELAVAVGFVTDDRTTDDAPLSRWAELAHALVNTKEFIFLR